LSFAPEEVEEFKNEALELLAMAEMSLLQVEAGEELKPRYDAIFRCFHSLKGAAGMLDWTELASHMHQIEDQFTAYKEHASLPSAVCSYFLDAIDATRVIMNGKKIDFKYELDNKNVVTSPLLEHEISINNQDTADVFIVDDEPDLIEILGDMLTNAQLSWKGFTEPKNALASLEAYHPKLILSDYKMPSMTGLELLSLVREQRKDIPFIMISAYLSKENILDAYAKGINGIIEKPFKESFVLSQVHQVLASKEMEKLLNETFEFLLFQMPEMEEYLNDEAQKEKIKALRAKLVTLISKKGELRKIRIKNKN
jgi:CheY-like chemotaxis protein/HPt (histidine-containing phosphotransfer) domain-containing protein